MKPPIFFLNDDAKILDLMKKGDDDALVMIYQQNRKAIVSLVLKNNGSNDDAEDVIQDSVIILWERVRSGRFEYTAKLSTFLFAIAKNVWSRKRVRRQRETPTKMESDFLESGDASQLELMVESERSQTVASALEKLGDPCKTLLLLYYWEEKSQEDIAAQMGFANAATVKSKKYTCKKMLEKILKDSGFMLGLI
ncbi:MAG: sigma-70 family RNA polymerase sigma factor [Bacteroidota bacterium]|nr:sigma-70 family RNA polymerase sigma factor [Bacteroidota bacterium]